MSGVGPADLVYLFVSDMDRAVGFYRDVLGLELEARAGDDWAQFRAGRLALGLHGTQHGGGRPGGTIAFTVDDLDGARLRLVDAGVSVGHEGGGNGQPRFVEFSDPDANVLALVERGSSSERGGASGARREAGSSSERGDASVARREAPGA